MDVTTTVSVITPATMHTDALQGMQNNTHTKLQKRYNIEKN